MVFLQMVDCIIMPTLAILLGQGDKILKCCEGWLLFWSLTPYVSHSYRDGLETIERRSEDSFFLGLEG
jgi:hypothetical protein